MVRGLKWRPRFDVDELAGGYVAPLGRVADIHRQDAAEDDEGLLLVAMAMTATLRTGFVAPDVPARVPEVRQITELGNMPRGFAGLVRPSDPLPVATANNAEAHGAILGTGVTARGWSRTRLGDLSDAGANAG